MRSRRSSVYPDEENNNSVYSPGTRPDEPTGQDHISRCTGPNMTFNQPAYDSGDHSAADIGWQTTPPVQQSAPVRTYHAAGYSGHAPAGGGYSNPMPGPAVPGPFAQTPPPAPVPGKPVKKHHRKRSPFRMIFISFLSVSGAVAWIFLLLKFVIVPLLSLLSHGA